MHKKVKIEKAVNADVQSEQPKDTLHDKASPEKDLSAESRIATAAHPDDLSQWTQKDRDKLADSLLKNSKTGKPSLLDLSAEYGVPLSTISGWKAQIIKNSPDIGTQTPNNATATETAFDRMAQESKRRHRKKIKRCVILIIVLAVIAGALAAGYDAYQSYRRPTDVLKYVKVSYDGLSGYGTATAEFDSDSFNSAYGTDLSDSSVVIKVDPNDHLANSDKISVSITDSGDLDKARLKPAQLDRTDVVSGLSRGTPVDIFKDVSVQFQGVSGEGTATINSEDTADNLIKQAKFSLDKTEGLSEGDTVTVTATIPESAIESTREVPLSTTKDYTVQSLSRYPQGAGEISTDAVKGLADEEKKNLELALSKGGITSDHNGHPLWIEERIGKDSVDYFLLEDAASESFTKDDLSHAWLVSNGNDTLSLQSKYTSYLGGTDGSSESDTTSDSIKKSTQYHNLLIMTFETQMQWTGTGSRFPAATKPAYYTAIYSNVLVNADGTLDTSKAKKLFDDYETKDVCFDADSPYAKCVKPLENNTVSQIM